MLKIGVIGIGNTGNQIARLAHEKLGIKVLAINSSSKDLETIGDIPKILIQNEALTSEGAGKDRKLAKSYLKDTISKIISSSELTNLLVDLDIVFVISSTGGGTGSGVAPMFSEILTTINKSCKVILVGVLPVNSEALSSHVNTLEYLQEVYQTLNKPTYMLYDNDKADEVSSIKKLEKVNEEIVADMQVIRCMYNIPTRYDSIDDRDAKRLIGFPGRIVVARVEDFHEKDIDSESIEDKVINAIKKNCHVETQRDKTIMAAGLITNLDQDLIERLDDNIPLVTSFTGEPIHRFTHIGVNTDRKAANNVFLILSGLAKINDKINVISDRIDDIKKKQEILEAEDALNTIDLKGLTESISSAEADAGIDEVIPESGQKEKLKDVFAKFL